MMKKIISRLTMVKTGRSFWDNIGKENVYYWQDVYFEQFIAASRWDCRMKIK
tara:strand:+ start:4857 stop:5012 length:156 start_codon:yes stop_codon:yes gene_type:complete